MITIDTKDRKILYELDMNARQSFSHIGKKTGLTKSTVAYRINRLEQEGIIKNYYTFIDGMRMGYTILRLYTIYQYTTKEIEQEILNHFIKNKSAVAIYLIEGRFNIEVVFWIKDNNELYNFWQETLNRYGDYFQDQLLSFYFRLIAFKQTFLVTEKRVFSHAQNKDIMGKEKPITIDDIDYQILKVLATNARKPMLDIAEELAMNSHTVMYHIKKLQKMGIIRSFRVNIDYTKLGYLYFKVDIYLKDYSQRNKIIEYISTDPHIVSINETTGISHLEIEVIVPTLHQLHQIMNDLYQKFPYAMRNHKYFMFTHLHKYVFLPE